MSASVIAYAVDPEAVWRAFGSRDQALLDRVLSDERDRLDELDEVFEAKAPAPAIAMANYIAGTAPHNAWVHHNLSIIEVLCAALGDEFGIDAWERVNADFVMAVNAVLRDGAVPLDLEKALWSGPPSRIPTRNPYQSDPGSSCGFVTVAEVAAVAPALTGLIVPKNADPYVAAAVFELRDWFAAAAKRRRGLAFFYG